MHGTACAPGYPSDSTRSLAGVGPQDDWRARRQPPARPTPGHSRACAPPRLPLEPCGPGGPEGGGAGLTGVSRDRHAAAPAWLLPRRRRQRSGRVAPARNRQRRHASSSATIHGPRAAGVGAAVRARAGYVGGHPATTHSLTLAGVGQCPLADGHGRQTGRPRSIGSSASVATGGPGTLSGAGRAGVAVGGLP